MNKNLLLGLSATTCVVLLIIVAFLAGRLGRDDGGHEPGPDDEPVGPGTVKEVINPNPPAPVQNPDRVRQNLQPGKTYITHTKGTLHVRATDKAWGIEEVVTVNYAFEARIDREIESNDGTTIVELRHFRDVRSLKVLTQLEDIRLDLGPAGDLLIAGLSLFQDPATEIAAGTIAALDGQSTKPLLNALRWAGISPEELTGLDERSKIFASVDRLSGKSVRLTYVDGVGVIKLEPVEGEMTLAEQEFHTSSVLVSDSLIIPNVDIEPGIRWTVDGSNFANFLDPSLLACTSGEVTLERSEGDYIAQNKTCTHLQVVGGRIYLDASDAKKGSIGWFEPRGSLDFSPDDQVIIQAKLQGTAKLEEFSTDHLLFETRMRRMPEIEIVYTCRVEDTAHTEQP